MSPSSQLIIISNEPTKQFAPFPVVSFKWLDAVQAGTALTAESLQDYGFLFQGAAKVFLYTSEAGPEAKLWLTSMQKLIGVNGGQVCSSPEPGCVVLLREKNERVVEAIQGVIKTFKLTEDAFSKVTFVN